MKNRCLFALTLLVASTGTAFADHPCKSTYQRLGNQWTKFGPAVKSLLSTAACQGNSAACLQTWATAEKEATSYVHEFNERVGDSPLHLGPRALTIGAVETGELHTERVFTGGPLLSPGGLYRTDDQVLIDIRKVF